MMATAALRRLRTLTALTAAGVWFHTPTALTAEATPDAASADVVLESNVMVAMRDGTQLATDIYRPAQGGKARDGRFPAILMRTPYNKEVRARAFSGSQAPARYFASHGYVVVMQDVRGRYKSQGHWRPWYDDGRDGYDTTQWIGRQAWSDGRIGTVGTSYEGGTQQALALANAPNVKAMVPLFSVSNIARYGIRHNGAFELRWFDHWLKGVDNGVDREPPVRLYVMGGGDAHKTTEGRLFVGGHWRDEKDWPLARAKTTPYFLHAGGVLSADAPAAAAPITYRFDPRHPVPTLGGNLSSQGPLASEGGADQRCRTDLWTCEDGAPLSARNDILVFATPTLAEDLEVTGPLVVKLWASSDGPDTDFTAKLIDVYPPNADYPAGIDMIIGDSIVRARYRDGPTKPQMLERGKAYEFTIEMYPTSIVFQRGHRIRLDISSSNFPRFDVNPNTGEPLNDNRSSRVAENTVYLDPAHPSRILLPVIPAGTR